MAYFISWANKFHMTSALIFPTFSSCGNLIRMEAILLVWQVNLVLDCEIGGKACVGID